MSCCLRTSTIREVSSSVAWAGRSTAGTPSAAGAGTPRIGSAAGGTAALGAAGAAGVTGALGESAGAGAGDSPSSGAAAGPGAGISAPLAAGSWKRDPPDACQAAQGAPRLVVVRVNLQRLEEEGPSLGGFALSQGLTTELGQLPREGWGLGGASRDA